MTDESLIGKNVWVLVVSHRHGENISVHATEDGANAALASYCREWWDRETPGSKRINAPKNDKKLVEDYFEMVEDESALIQARTISE